MASSGKRLTPEDVQTFPILSDARIDPAGETVAFVRGSLTRENTKLPRQNIWVVNADGTNERQFSHGPRADFMPRWSPDGTQIAFFSDRLEDGKLQLYVMDRAGGEATKLADVKGEIDTSRAKDALQWSPDGKRLAFTMVDPLSEEEKKKKDNKDDAIEFEKVHRYTRVWTIDLAKRKLKAVTRGRVQVWEFQWSPNGREFALIVSAQPYEWSWYETRLARVSTNGGTPRDVYTPEKRQIALPRWSPDMNAIAFLSSIWSDRGVTQGAVFTVDARGGKPHELAPDYNGSIGWINWVKNGRTLLGAGHEQGQAALTEIDVRSRKLKTIWRAAVGITEPFWPRYTLSHDHRRLALVRHGPKDPRNVWRADLKTSASGTKVEWAKLSQAIPAATLRSFAIGEQEIVRWKSRDGLAIQGVLIKPPGFVKGRRYPTIVNPHGGPTSLAGNVFSAGALWGQMLAARGYVVFQPNFRGSSGFGLAFAEANVGDMGGMDFQDIESGVEALIAQGIADPKRLGIGGWSYGGFMTCWTVTQTTRYKAAVMGAGISNWLSFHGNSHLHSWDAIHYAAHPYERDGVYAKFSGMNFVQRVRTPTLILHGEQDRDVPAEQGYQFYRALKDHRVPTELVLFPREGHGISEKAHWLDLHHRMGDWYDRYLK
jgi:dipeptidyl aminopeptidase/acylaminoacyl peptidase